jgi:hypothetical protein
MPSSAPTSSTATRRLRAPIRSLLTGDDVRAFMAAQQNRDESGVSVVSLVAESSQRVLQDGAAQSEFGLKVGLQGINGVPSDQDDSSSSSDGGSPILVAVVVLILLANGCGLGFFSFALYAKSRNEGIAVDKNHHHRGSAASVGTYPSQRFVYSTSSVQNANHRGGARDT